MTTITTIGPENGSPAWFKHWLRKGHEETMRELLATCKSFNKLADENQRLRAALERCREFFDLVGDSELEILCAEALEGGK